MFKRIDKRNNVNDYKMLPEYNEAERLYQESIKYQQEGDPKKSTDSYLQAMEIQAKLSSISLDSQISKQMEHLPQLPIEIWIIISSYLTIEELSKLSLVCRYFKYLADDSLIWQEKYFSHFSKISPNNTLNDRNSNAILTNWKLLYRDQLEIQKYFKIIFFYFLPHESFFGSLAESLAKKPMNSRWNEWNDVYERGELDEIYSSFPSVANRVHGHYWSAGSGCHEYTIGNECTTGNGVFARIADPAEITRFMPVNKNKVQFIDQSRLLENLINWIFHAAFSVLLSAKAHPSLFIVPFIENCEIRKMADIFFSNEVGVSYLSIQSDAVIGLYSTNIHNAIVISFSVENIISIIPIHERNVISGQSKSWEISSGLDFSEFTECLQEIVKANESDLLSENRVYLQVFGKFIPDNFISNCETKLPHLFNFNKIPLSVIEGYRAFAHDPSVRKQFFTKNQYENTYFTLY